MAPMAKSGFRRGQETDFRDKMLARRGEGFANVRTLAGARFRRLRSGGGDDPLPLANGVVSPGRKIVKDLDFAVRPEHLDFVGLFVFAEAEVEPKVVLR